MTVPDLVARAIAIGRDLTQNTEALNEALLRVESALQTIGIEGRVDADESSGEVVSFSRSTSAKGMHLSITDGQAIMFLTFASRGHRIAIAKAIPALFEKICAEADDEISDLKGATHSALSIFEDETEAS